MCEIAGRMHSVISIQRGERPKAGKSQEAASPTLKIVVWETHSLTQEDATLFFHAFIGDSNGQEQYQA